MHELLEAQYQTTEGGRLELARSIRRSIFFYLLIEFFLYLGNAPRGGEVNKEGYNGGSDKDDEHIIAQSSYIGTCLSGDQRPKSHGWTLGKVRLGEEGMEVT